MLMFVQHFCRARNTCPRLRAVPSLVPNTPKRWHPPHLRTKNLGLREVRELVKVTRQLEAGRHTQGFWLYPFTALPTPCSEEGLTKTATVKTHCKWP